MAQVSVERKLHDKLDATYRVRGDYERFVSANLCGFSIHVETDSRFEVSAHASSVADFTISRFRTRAGKGRLNREQQDVRCNTESRYGIFLPVAGLLEVQQFDRTEVFSPGSMAFVTTSEILSYKKLGDNDTVYFFLPQSFVDQRLIGAEDLCGRKFNLAAGLPKLLSDSITALQSNSLLMSEADFREAAHFVGELALTVLRKSGDVNSSASPVRAANLSRIKRTVRKRCFEPGLSVVDIADDCGLSLRYVQDLFQDDARTCSEYILTERLEHARRLLERSTGATKVTDVCFASGFSNVSHFSTAFRRAFGLSPRDILKRTHRPS